MIILGIETSCDDTALALIETRGDAAAREPGKGFQCRVIESLVHSQAELHSAYGGVFPTLAKREHSKNLVPLLHKLFIEAGEALKEVAGREHSPSASCGTRSAPLRSDSPRMPRENIPFLQTLQSLRTRFADQNPDLYEAVAHASFLQNIPPIDAIAVTEGPGLEPALWTGIVFARMLSALWDIPIIPVNHMEGHIVGSLLPSDATNGAWQDLHDLPFPAIALLISGGHTELIKASGLGEYEIIGETKDDAVGEAFDKVARMLGLPYPGGPHIAKLAHEAWEMKIASPIVLPRPMIKSGDLDFSFSGLKTAVLYALRDEMKKNGGMPEDSGMLSDIFKKGLAYEFEQAVADTLEAKLKAGIEKTGAKAVIIGGGVSANHVLRQRFERVAKGCGLPLYMPSRHLSGDNALMIALAGALDAKALTGAPAKNRELRAHGTKRLGAE